MAKVTVKVKAEIEKPKKSRTRYTEIVDPYNGLPCGVLTDRGRWSPAPGAMPNEVTVYGQKYRVYYHSRIYNAPKKDQQLRGVVVYAHRIIILDPEQTFHELRETLYHEAGHIYLKHWQNKGSILRKLTHAQTEDLCDMFGEAVCDLARNNPRPE